MPKIDIKEYDLTTAGTDSYSNFSVVVPGFANPLIDEFDENGVYECSSLSDFETYIGKVKATTIDVPGEGPTLTVLATEIVEGVEVPVYKKTLEKAEFEYKYTDCVYITEAAGSTAVKGRLIGPMPDDTAQTPTLYKFTKATEWAENTQYVVIDKGYEGKNPIKDNQGHIGNQIAYELVKLGYTVLFKKLTSVEELPTGAFWEALKDRSNYDFRYIIAGMIDDLPGATMAGVNTQMIAVAKRDNDAASLEDTGRGDCFALCEVPRSVYVQNNKALTGDNLVNAIKVSLPAATEYAAAFVPTVTYSDALADPDYDNNVTFPAAFEYLASAKNAFKYFNEWYAVAGFVRGVSPYTIKSLAAKIGDLAINKLEPRGGTGRAVNVITNIKGQFYLWGNRTLASFTGSATEGLTAKNFLNIRQLCTTIKKQLYLNCRNITFDPNSDALWIKFVGLIEPLLQKMKGDQGVKDFKVVRLKTDKKATLAAAIRIVPIEAVEDFDISIYLEDSISGTLAGEIEE